MLFKLKRALALRSYNRGVSGVLRTAAVRCDPSSRVTLVTQIYPPDVFMYLVAVKGFTRHVPVKQCHVVSDRLSDEDKATIRKHVPKGRGPREMFLPCPHSDPWIPVTAEAYERPAPPIIILR